MKYFVYILCSIEHKSLYIGQTTDLDKRLKLHNSKKVRTTKAKAPWQLLLFAL